MSEAARSRRDNVRFGAQTGAPGRDGAVDPLAELARLVGQEDPFRSVFRSAPSADRSRHLAAEPHPAQDPYSAGERHAGAVDGGGGSRHDPEGQGGQRDDLDPHGAVEGAAWNHPDYDGDGRIVHHEGDEQAADDERYYAAEQYAHPDEAGIADERLAADEAAAATLPDMWARGGDLTHPGVASVERGHPLRGSDATERSSARRPLAVLAAVLLLTGGGLAASFFARGPAPSGATTADAGRSAPTIMAAAGPTKVKVEDPGATAPEDQDAALLSKNGNVSSGPVKIVSSQEQPADLSLLPKTADLAEGARPLPPAAPSPFPEPKKVKTFVVHPDGTMLSPDSTAGGLPGAGAPEAIPLSTSRTPARAGTPPKGAPPPATIASLTADPPPAEAAPRQPASPGARVAVAKPNDSADAPGASTGGYGLQLSSSPVEADAQAAFGKLKKKYPSLLGSLTASVHRAETGDKPVYRVRVGGMSQDEAKSLCSKLQTAGGTCFVVHN